MVIQLKLIVKKLLQCCFNSPYILKTSKPVFEFNYSKKEKYLSCLISKNGCSSIASSILSYDFGETTDENKKIWLELGLWKHHESDFKLMFSDQKEINLDSFATFRKFIVLRDPFDRFVSLINHTHKEHEYDQVFDKSLPAEKYIDSVLRFFPYMIDYKRKDFKFDKHAVPQRVYYEKYKEIFGDGLEVVMIKDLPAYYERLTGKPLIKNNVTKESEKICTKDSLTTKQKKIIERYLMKYEFCKDDEYSSFFKH